MGIGFIDRLSALVRSSVLVEVERDLPTSPNIRGFVVGVSSRFLMIRILSDDFQLNGYSIIPIDTVSQYRIASEYQEMVDYLLGYEGDDVDGFDSTSFIKMASDFEFLKDVHKYFPVVSVFLEDEEEYVFELGLVEEVLESTLIMRTISPTGIIAKDVTMIDLDEVTRIDFGGAYEEAVWNYSCFIN